MHVRRRFTSGICFVVVLLPFLACNAISGLNDTYSLDEAGVTTLPDGAVIGPDGAILTDGSILGADGPLTEPDAMAPLDCSDPPGIENGAVVWCDNFEDDAKHWSSAFNTGGTPQVEANVGRNGTRGLHAKTTVTAAKSTSSALLNTFKMDFATGTTLWLSFYFNAQQAGIDYTELGAIQFSGIEHGIALYSSPVGCPNGAPCINENDQVPGHGHDPTLALKGDLSRWYHAEVFLTRMGDDYGSKVLLDGTVIKERTTGAMPKGNINPPNEIDLIVGAFYSGVTKATTDVIIDDVVLRQK